MKNLMDIILDGEQLHEYRLKFAFEPSEHQVTRIKQLLEKYDLVSSDPMKRTIFQSRPLDFYNLDAGEIWMMDVSTARPVSDNVLLYEMGSLLKVSEALLRVRPKNAPYQEQLAEQEDDLQLDEYVTKLTDTDYTDAPEINIDELAGDKFVDTVVDKAVQEYSKDRTPYAAYMMAGFEAMNPPQAQSDAPADGGPTKE